MKIFLTIIIITVIFAIACIAENYQRNNDQIFVDNWASQNGYVIKSSERSVWSQGPFFWYDDDDYRFQHVIVVDRKGATHDFWFALGLGIYKNEVKEVPQ